MAATRPTEPRSCQSEFSQPITTVLPCNTIDRMYRTANDIPSTTRSTKDTEQSSHWAIVYLGIGKSNKEEYHILNRATGTYLSTTCKLPAKTR
jgi:hypothetical protein